MAERRIARKRSIWAYYIASVSIAFAALVGTAWYNSYQYRQFFTQQLQVILEDRASIVAAEILSRDSADLITVLDRDCSIPGSVKRIRMTIVALDGQVICDSEVDAATMDNHGNRPEIRGAYAGQTSVSTRTSDTLGASYLYVAVPARTEDTVHVVVRAAMSLRSINELLTGLWGTSIGLGLLLLLGFILLSVFLYQKINPPLRGIVEGANRFAQGRFLSKLPSYDVREIAEIADAMNSMASQLQNLETIRRDFVANVSHELKTPITSIRGFVETLRDGAKENEEDLERFLDILSKQSLRLEAIVDDLLTLSRLESQPVSELLSLERENLSGILSSALELSSARAEAKSIGLTLDCPSDIEVNVDRSLFTLAVSNLVENAIRYSDDETVVLVRARAVNDSARIDVMDQGPGIAPQHLARLFERFYRVDKARSRTLGGTGLGLAIVKHVAALHNGTISVDSEPGQGTTFHLFVPLAA